MTKMTLLLLFVLLSCASDHLVSKHIPANKLHACFTGDMGSGWAAQKVVAKLLIEEKCDKHFFLGDLIYPDGLKNTKDPEFETKFLKPYDAIIKDNKEFYIVLGNHDHHQNPLVWKDLAKDWPFLIHPHPYYRVNMDGLCFVVIDSSNLTFYTSIVSGIEQRNWLDDIEPWLKKSCSLKIMLSHHPYLNRGSNHGNSGGPLKNMQEKYILGHYDYMISGHEHLLSDEGQKKGTRLFVSGAGGKPAKDEAAGFLVMDFEKRDDRWIVTNSEFKRVVVP